MSWTYIATIAGTWILCGMIVLIGNAIERRYRRRYQAWEDEIRKSRQADWKDPDSKVGSSTRP